ncbi:MAG TPA: pilus assembly protein TadG-related protein [Symbiobacteriaceae bacterium]|nr:pilus assembly protein TadG-related protein [Symbiobacteriaceae bacterium]
MPNRFRHDSEQGSVTVVVAAAMVAIIGLVALGTDVGRMYIAQERMATVADAAALSGAQFLPHDYDGAVAAVQTYLTRNGVDPQSVTFAVDEAASTLSVIVEDTVSYTFGRIFGRATGRVEASAVARVASVSGYNNVVPLGVVQADWTLGDPVVLKASPGGGGQNSPGNYGALSLGGRGASAYEENLAEGYTGWVRVGDLIPTEPGNMAGPTQRALQARLSANPDVTYGSVRKGSPRIMIVPVLESFDVNGRGEVRIVGFGAFFLESVGTHGNDRGTVYGRFLRYVVTGESGGNAADFAAYTIKLTH